MNEHVPTHSIVSLNYNVDYNQAMQDLKNSYSKMLEIRLFEETLLEKFTTGAFGGTTHTYYIGQEANGSRHHSLLRTPRCHLQQPSLSRSFSGLRRFPASPLRRNDGQTIRWSVPGKGGSQHLHWKNFYSSGIQGSLVPVRSRHGLCQQTLT